ncbi:MAG: TVP38/TMEM64 family protein [Pseudohongiellaceae bacterium]
MLLVLALNPAFVSRESIASLLSQMGTSAFIAYVLLSLARALVMIPSTPFILAGAVSFPHMPFAVFLVSYLGVVVGTVLIYSFPSFGNYDEYLEAKYPKKIGAIREKMQGPYSFWIVIGWSFFPLVPTDLISYVAGIAKMPLKKLIAAVVIGELPIVTFYVFAGIELGEWLRL